MQIFRKHFSYPAPAGFLMAKNMFSQHAAKAVFFLLVISFFAVNNSFAADAAPDAKNTAAARANDRPDAKNAAQSSAKKDAASERKTGGEAAKENTDKGATAKNDAASKKDAESGKDKESAAAKGDVGQADANNQADDANAKKEGDNPARPTVDEEVAAVQNTAWEAMWTGQRESLNEMRETALKLSETFSTQTNNLSRHLQPLEEEARRLLVFANTFKGHPNAMESVQRRIQGTIDDFNSVLEPVLQARTEAQGLLERVNKMADSIPQDMDKSRLSDEMQTYIQDINKARLRLTVVLALYDSLTPSMSLLLRLEKVSKEIGEELPALWKDYYLSGPIPWLSTESWTGVGQKLYYSRQALILRMPVELPVTWSQWSTAILRFAIGLVFAGVLCLILKKRWPEKLKTAASRHLFRVSLPWICLGFAFFGSALSATSHFFRLFLAMGSICLIMGQVSLAWDIRLLKHPDVPMQKAPFLGLLPLAFCAYLLLYLPLTPTITLVLWLLLLLGWLFWQKKKKQSDIGPLQLEAGVMDGEPVILWLCLFLTVSGMFIASMAIYLAYVSFSVALELSLGGMYLVNSINDHLSRAGARAILSHLAVAMAAPLVLVTAVIGVFLWVAVLPGGIYLLGEYALKGINVGQTQFNIIQMLLIISVFYLTRAVVSMGTSFLAKLPNQGINFDSTLITPLQTALTYTAWAVFGIFVLKSLGLELNSLAMVAGGLSVGIGFGMQTIVNNFLSGLILIFGRTLQVGDVVEVGGITGRVRKISVRATMVETYDNAVIYVPNSQFMASPLINWTSFSRSVRKEVQVGVAYGSDTEEVVKLLVSIAKGHDNVLKYPVPSVNFADFAASSLDFRLRFWVKDFELGATTCSDIRMEIDKIFAEKNIEIAFPQLDVHLKREDSAPAAPLRVKPPRPVARPPLRRRPPPELAEKVALARHESRSQTD